MHIAATNPISISIEDMPADLIERKKYFSRRGQIIW